MLSVLVGAVIRSGRSCCPVRSELLLGPVGARRVIAGTPRKLRRGLVAVRIKAPSETLLRLCGGVEHDGCQALALLVAPRVELIEKSRLLCI